MRIEFNLEDCDDCIIRAEIVGNEIWLTKLKHDDMGDNFFTLNELEFVTKLARMVNEGNLR